MLLDQIYKQGKITSVAGTAIGNGCWGTAPGTNCGDVTGHSGMVKKIDVEYFLGRGLISKTLAAAANAACSDGAWTDPLSANCLAAYVNISSALGPLDIDNVDSFCPLQFQQLHTLEQHRDQRRPAYARQHSDPISGLWQPLSLPSMTINISSHSGGREGEVSDGEDPVIGAVQMW